MIYKAEVYNKNATSWRDVTSATGNDDVFPWVADFTDGAFKINTGGTWTPYDSDRDFDVRITYTSKYSKKPEKDRTKVE